MATQLTQMAMDAYLPLIRPDSIVAPLAGHPDDDGCLWAIFTPSSGRGALVMGTQDECKSELEKIGTVRHPKGSEYRWVIDSLNEPDYYENLKATLAADGLETW